MQQLFSVAKGHAYTYLVPIGTTILGNEDLIGTKLTGNRDLMKICQDTSILHKV
jgi:hypothetical protein